MTHLGERVTALVDGQLPVDATERALAHLAQCRPCRDAVEVERRMKARLAGLADPEPADALVGRLLALGGPAGPLPPRAGHVPGSPRPRPVSGPRSRTDRPAGRPVPAGVARPLGRGGRVSPLGRRTGRRTRLTVAMLGTLTVLGAGVTGLVISGGPSAAPVVPPVDSFVVEHAVTTSNLPFVDLPAGWQGAPLGQVEASSVPAPDSGAGK